MENIAHPSGDSHTFPLRPGGEGEAWGSVTSGKGSLGVDLMSKVAHRNGFNLFDGS